MRYRIFNFQDLSTLLVCVQPAVTGFTVQTTCYIGDLAYTAHMRYDMPFEEAMDHVQATTPEDALCFRLEAGHALGIDEPVELIQA